MITRCAIADGADPVQQSVNRALVWLGSQQMANGSWSTNSALNALPILAYLSAGNTPDSPDHPVNRGIRFILPQQDTQGGFTYGGGMMYGHGITTLVLAEMTGLSDRDLKVREALQYAVNLILRSQAVAKSTFHQGGWRYYPNSADSDLSVTVWQLIALKAASDVGIQVPTTAIESAVGYLQRCAHPQGGFGYQPGGLPNPGRTAAAVTTLQLCGIQDDTLLKRSMNWLQTNTTGTDDIFYYYAIYQVAHAGSGFDRHALIESQKINGSWLPFNEKSPENRAGPLYSTSMAVLALTADYHYLPAYLR